MEKKNPIDEKVDKITEVITTSRSVYKTLILIWYLALVVGIGFIIAAPIIYNSEQSSDGVVYGFFVALPVGIVIVIVSLILLSSTKKKLKKLTN